MNQATIVQPLQLAIDEFQRIRDRDEHLVAMARGKRVLHVGCADWPITAERSDDLLHARLTEASPDVVGIDISERGLEELRRRGFENVMHGDAQRLDEHFPDQHFDLIVAGETLEHLPNPGLFLESARRVLRDDGTLLITVPNAFYLLRLIVLFLRRSEIVHRDHNYYFSIKTLNRLLATAGFRITFAGFTRPVEMKRLTAFLFDRAHTLFPYCGQSVVVHASKHTDGEAPALREVLR